MIFQGGGSGPPIPPPLDLHLSNSVVGVKKLFFLFACLFVVVFFFLFFFLGGGVNKLMPC